MSREIKFRAWDKLNKKIVTSGLSINLDTTGRVIPISFSQGDLSYCRDNDVHMVPNVANEIQIMQYTGLTDRNGVEIYEGDILRVPASNEYEVTTYNSFEVFWHDNDATPTDCGLVLGRLNPHGNSAGGYSGYKLVPKHVSQMEVIGNIYENPELLEAEL